MSNIPIPYPSISPFEQLQIHNQADPRTNPFGYLVWHNGFACGPVTIGVFMWYPTQQAMLAGISELEVYSSLEEGDELEPDDLLIQQHFRELTTQFQEGKLDALTLSKKLSEVTRSLDFEWIGSFEELCSGNSEFAREVRERYYEDMSDDDDVLDTLPPIQEDDLEDFIDMIRFWGV